MSTNFLSYFFQMDPYARELKWLILVTTLILT